MIKLRIIQEHGIGGLAVRFWTNSPWSHVEFEIDEPPELAGYLSARPIGGVMVRPRDYIKPDRVSVGIVYCDDTVTAAVMKFAYAQIGKSYDYMDILDFVIHRDWVQQNKWDCSQLIYCAFAQANYPILNPAHTNRITPRDIFLSPKIQWSEVNLNGVST